LRHLLQLSGRRGPPTRPPMRLPSARR
jgi:hypothetical protein